MTTATKDAQIAMGEQTLSNDALLAMLQTWDNTREDADRYKQALAAIKKNAPNAIGRYRVGPYVLIVSQKKTVQIETVD